MSNEDNDTCALVDEEAAMNALADEVARRAGYAPRGESHDAYTFITLAVDNLVSVVNAAKASLKHCQAERDLHRNELEKVKVRLGAAQDALAEWRERCTANETVGRHEWGVVANALGLDPATLTAGEVVEAIRARVVTKATAVPGLHTGYRKVDTQVTTIIDNMINALALSGRAIEAAAEALAVMNGGNHE